MAKKDDSLTAEVQSGLDGLAAAQLAALNDAVGVHVGMQTLLLNEAQRLQDKLGAQSERSRQIAALLQSNQERYRQLALQAQLAQITLPEVAADGGLIYGRIVDPDGLGMDRLVAYLVDPSGERINLNSTTSDASGFFAIPMDAATIARINKASPKGIFLAVSTPRGRLIYSQPNPLTLTNGMRLQLEIKLNR